MQAIDARDQGLRPLGDLWLDIEGQPRPPATGVLRSYENVFPQDPTVGLCLGPYESLDTVVPRS